jgi:tRNA(Met) cytidine acetyltransferase
VHFLRPKVSDTLLLPEPPRKTLANVYASDDQEHAVTAILKVVSGHRRRPLVITSDRGRGKSAALGIAAAELIKKGILNIIICAPSKQIAAMVFKHAELNLRLDTNLNDKLRFFSPDDMQCEQPDADLVLVDEAAAIPLSMLTFFLKRYSRIVFASTQHGYEGSGRGFTINFRRILDAETPDWKNCQLRTPIRWQDNDSLEKFTFDALLLDAEPAETSVVKKTQINECSFVQVNKYELLKDEAMLRQVFGLLVGAHYQTKPSDLMHLLDDRDISIFCLESNEPIIAVALVVREGNIDSALSTEIFEGKRRIQGHLVAQSLSANVGVEFANEISGDRIIRIAVHPDLQQQGFGKHLLKQLIEISDADYISTSYGVTVPLLQFWQASGFIAVYLGMKRDASSGRHSVIMLHAKTEAGEKIQQQARYNFSNSFPQLLSDPLRSLESDVALALLPEKTVSSSFSSEERRMIEGFATGHRGYENTLYLIWKLVCEKLPDNQLLNNEEKRILILKVLQKHSWKTTIEKMCGKVKGKNEAISVLRSAVAGLLQ